MYDGANTVLNFSDILCIMNVLYRFSLSFLFFAFSVFRKAVHDV